MARDRAAISQKEEAPPVAFPTGVVLEEQVRPRVGQRAWVSGALQPAGGVGERTAAGRSAGVLSVGGPFGAGALGPFMTSISVSPS